jgi:hypothetical protein
LELLGDSAQPTSLKSVNDSGMYGYNLFTQVSEVCHVFYGMILIAIQIAHLNYV